MGLHSNQGESPNAHDVDARVQTALSILDLASGAAAQQYLNEQHEGGSNDPADIALTLANMTAANIPDAMQRLAELQDQQSQGV